jgi:hypothetical protein
MAASVSLAKNAVERALYFIGSSSISALELSTETRVLLA